MILPWHFTRAGHIRNIAFQGAGAEAADKFGSLDNQEDIAAWTTPPCGGAVCHLSGILSIAKALEK